MRNIDRFSIGECKKERKMNGIEWCFVILLALCACCFAFDTLPEKRGNPLASEIATFKTLLTYPSSAVIDSTEKAETNRIEQAEKAIKDEEKRLAETKNKLPLMSEADKQIYYKDLWEAEIRKKNLADAKKDFWRNVMVEAW